MSATDIAMQTPAEDRERLAREVLDLVNRAEVFQNTVHEVLLLIKQRTGIEAVGIRLRDGDDFPHFDADGFSENFLHTERYLCARDASGSPIRDESGGPVLECMCGMVIRGRTDATQRFFTEGGSFWTNSTTHLLTTTTAKERRTGTRNRCHDEGYESVALIPLRSGGQILGLLQLNDRRQGRFTPEMIHFFEGLGASLGIALSRRRAEDALRESNQKLQEALEQLTRVQDQVIQHERLNALGQMAAGIAHDFNNALVPVLGYTELLLSTPGVLDDRRQTLRMLELVRTGTMNAAATVSRLTEFCRQVDGSQQVPVDLYRVIGNTVAMTRPRWKGEMRVRGVAIEIQTEIAPVPQILGDPNELNTLLANLVLNAVDAIPGGGSITIRLFTHVSGRCVVVEVQDTGVGMSEEVRRRCLDPFFTTKNGRGVGLGLSVAHGIVQRHKGSIEVQSAPGKGTKVIVQLPVIEPRRLQPGEEKKPLPVHMPRAAPLRVLFVDDEESARLLLCHYLVADGHTVDLASDGAEGLATFKSRPFDVVILDRAMPGMNGDELAARIKGISPGTPVIMLTGFGDVMMDQGNHPAGVDRVMAKPLTREALRRVMAEIMTDKRKPRGANRSISH